MTPAMFRAVLGDIGLSARALAREMIDREMLSDTRLGRDGREIRAYLDGAADIPPDVVDAARRLAAERRPPDDYRTLLREVRARAPAASLIYAELLLILVAARGADRAVADLAEEITESRDDSAVRRACKRLHSWGLAHMARGRSRYEGATIRLR